jgi:hypothetical protein
MVREFRKGQGRMTDEKSNVISFENKDRPLLAVKNDNTDYCFHRLVIDKYERIVSCSQCPKKFDPLEALIHIAKEWKIYALQSDRMKKEISDLHDNLDNLKKEINNHKAQLHRCKKKIEDKGV